MLKLNCNFWTKVKVGAVEDCWPFKGREANNGYGQVKFAGMRWSAHRLAYTLAKGAIPDGMMVCHRCDNKICVNPFHLWLGTAKDNVQDAVRKKRTRNSRKTKCPEGHDYYIKKDGRRRCRICDNEKRKAREKQRD